MLYIKYYHLPTIHSFELLEICSISFLEVFNRLALLLLQRRMPTFNTALNTRIFAMVPGAPCNYPENCLSFHRIVAKLVEDKTNYVSRNNVFYIICIR